MNIENIKHNIKYSYPKMDYFGEYFDVNSLLLNTATPETLKDMEENGKSGVKRNVNMLYKKIKGDREIVSGLKDPEKILPMEMAEVVTAIKVEKNHDSIYVTFPLKGVFNIVRKAQRGGIAEFNNVILDPVVNTKFRLKGSMLPYGNERYSISFANTENNQGFAIMCEPSTSGQKGSMTLRVSCFNENGYYIDDASKYIDVAPFLEGVS